MTAKTRATAVISPLRAFVFAAVLSVGLAAVVVPVLPGEIPLAPGDVAFTTFESDGKIIVPEGQRVTQTALSRIQQAGLLDNEFDVRGAVGAALIAVLAGALLGLYLYLFQPREVNTVPRLFMLGLLIVLWVAAAKVFLSITLPDQDRLYLGYILPVAALPMLVSTLLEGGLAVLIAALLAVLTTFAGFYMPDARSPLSGVPLDPLQMAIVFLLAGLTGIYAVRRADRVNHYVTAGLVVGLIAFVALFAFWLMAPQRAGADLVWMIAASALGGIGSAVITVGGTVVLGVMFGITTRIQLMELAQLSHPLLRQLQEKAPGTFHHSVIVGNLAERAADLTGADALLVRVGCYFHDIGKIGNPTYYVENQMGAENPHDSLEPRVSAKMVSDHVRYGLELAARYRLPARVRAFIPEHHGTRLVTYFYRKASADDPTVDPEKFRYPGPKPQSKETAIVMLADSVEAVVRSSKDRSPEKIDELVDGVIAERVAEGQLDETDLTLSDLRVIAEAFKATLRGIYHARIEYPAPTKEEAAAAAGSGIGYIKPPSEPMEAPPPR
jgi:putative nucleotidyltransferase with HDIG domain